MTTGNGKPIQDHSPSRSRTQERCQKKVTEPVDFAALRSTSH